MSLDLPGFADPVTETQACFRAVLDAMARPGRVHRAGAGLRPPAPLAPATAAVLLTLLDGDTPLWLDAGCAAARAWIGFHCGAPICAEPGQALFGLCLTFPDLTHFHDGSDEAPEDSATLIVQVGGFADGRKLVVHGPGLRAPSALCADGLPVGFIEAWQTNHRMFPRGVDLILCAGDLLAALPRSVVVEAG